MEERIVLVSDPSGEFPDNTNASFKVRLPETKELPGPGWEAALSALSVPDGGHTSKVIAEDATSKIAYSAVTYLLYQRPLTSGSFAPPKVKEIGDVGLTLADVWPDSVRVLNGVDFWKRVWKQLNLKEFEAFRRMTVLDIALNSDNKLKNVRLMHRTMRTEVNWEGEDFVVDSTFHGISYYEYPVPTFSYDFGISSWLAKQWGFLSDDETKLGPNVSFEPPSYNITQWWPSTYTPQGQQRSNPREHWGKVYEYGTESDPTEASGSVLWHVENGWMKFSRMVKWRFAGLNHAYDKLIGTQARELMVYSDMVDTTVVGNQRHQLLREVRFRRTGEGTSTVEPYHRQYIPIRGTHLDIIEMELGLPTGELANLTPGQTIVTIGIRKTPSE